MSRRDWNADAIALISSLVAEYNGEPYPRWEPARYLERIGDVLNSRPAEAPRSLVVHLVRRGVAMCGAGMPLEWPHLEWRRFTDPKATLDDVCPGCREALQAKTGSVVR